MLDISQFRLNRAQLLELAESLRPSFEDGDPFPHIVIPNFLPDPIAQALGREFPRLGEIDWLLEGPGYTSHSHDPDIEKVSCSHEEHFPPLTRQIMHEFNSSTFVDFLMALTGYESLLPDPWFGGCGLHSTGRGGRLMIHADSDRHPNTKMHQILNMIYYVTPGWQDEWGGHLELWDREAKTCIKRVKPEFNSVLVFFTGSKSFHGHPHPVTCPPGIRRNSLAAYYYTADRKLDADYEGRQREATWKVTNDLDRNLTAKQRIKVMAQNSLPPSAMRKLTGVLAALRS